MPLATVKRYMKAHRDQGAAGLFRPRRWRSASGLTAEFRQRAQALLEEGKSVSEVSAAIGARGDTVRTAIHAGRLHAAKKNS